MDWDDDGWALSAEELDSLERDAFQKIAQLQRQNPNSSSSSAPVKCSHYNNNKPQPPPPQRPQELHQRSLPSKPTTDSSSKKVEALSSGSRALPSSITTKVNTDEPSMGLPKLSVKFFLHAGGHIASKFSYDQVLVAAFRKIPKATWNAKERLWMFPISSLSLAEKVLGQISGYNVEVNIDPLVHRAIAAASALSDLQ